MRPRCASQIACDAGSPAPIACWSDSAAMGRPGSVRSRRSSASLRSGKRNARIPCQSVTASPVMIVSATIHASSSGATS